MLGRGSSEATTSLEQRERFSERFGNKLFLPALVIPFTAFAGTVLFNYTPLKGLGLIDPKSVTLSPPRRRRDPSALIVCYAWLSTSGDCAGDRGGAAADGFDRLGGGAAADARASLGTVFAAAGVGTTIGA